MVEHQPANYKPIARHIARFSIPTPLKWSSSTTDHVIELRPQLVRAPSLASNFSRAKWRGWVQNQQTVKIYLIMGVSWNETARPFQSISSSWTWVALPWANGSRTPRRCQTRRRTVAIKVNHCKLWVRSSGQQNIKWAEASTLNQTFANTVVSCPIIEQPYEPGLRVFTSYDRAPARESNKRYFKVQCLSMSSKF